MPRKNGYAPGSEDHEYWLTTMQLLKQVFSTPAERLQLAQKLGYASAIEISPSRLQRPIDSARMHRAAVILAAIENDETKENALAKVAVPTKKESPSRKVATPSAEVAPPAEPITTGTRLLPPRGYVIDHIDRALTHLTEAERELSAARGTALHILRPGLEEALTRLHDLQRFLRL